VRKRGVGVGGAWWGAVRGRGVGRGASIGGGGWRQLASCAGLRRGEGLCVGFTNKHAPQHFKTTAKKGAFALSLVASP